ncbi:hypothetical protein [Bifidobacterium angulatum]|uniref:hypothetical protein n=1 Tax=Bifidobacterium angulatum TaxID=1683 RepID=UPI003AB263AF
MTLVHFHLTDAEGRGLDGSVSLVPTRRVTVRDAIRLPVAQTVKLDKGEATAEVMPSTTQWVWRVSELVAGGIVRYVEVPDKESAEYSGLADVDPATLDPSSETVAAWETVTRAAQSALDQIDSIDDKVARAERSAQAAKASEGVAGQESAKAADAAVRALASQTAAASSASLAHEAETTAQGLIGEAKTIAARITETAAQVGRDAATADTAAKTAGGKADAAIDAQARAEAARQAAEDAMRTAADKAQAAGRSATAAQASESASAKSAESAGQSKSAASASESAAARSATAASDSAAKAKDSETAANASAANAETAAESANTSASTATGKAHDAATSADKAKASETAAKTSETVSAEHADTASAAASEAEKTLEQLRKWFPAATMRTDLWMEPVDFAVAGPYEIPDQPTISLKPVAAYLDGHTSDVDASMASRDAAVATLDGQTLTWVSNTTTLLAALKSDGYQPAEVTIKAGDTTVTKHVYLQADQPDGVVGDLWVRTEKLHNGLRYYTGAYGTAAKDANSMFFLVDRPREIWRKTIDGWKLLSGKELS